MEILPGLICVALFAVVALPGYGVAAESNSLKDFKDVSPAEQKRIQEEALAAINNVPGAEIRPFTEQDIGALEVAVKDWEIPYNFSRRFPIYLTGYDYENRPIWVGEFGKWNLRSAAEAPEEEAKAFEKYFLALAVNVLNSMKERSTPENPVNEISIIIDYDRLQIEQALSIRTLRLLLKLSRQYRDVIIGHVGDIIIINVNSVAQIAINLTRPIFAVLDDRLEIFGTNRDRWMPALRRKYPLEAIPSWYGGKKDYSPVKVLG